MLLLLLLLLYNSVTQGIREPGRLIFSSCFFSFLSFFQDYVDLVNFTTFLLKKKTQVQMVMLKEKKIKTNLQEDLKMS